MREDAIEGISPRCMPFVDMIRCDAITSSHNAFERCFSTFRFGWHRRRKHVPLSLPSEPRDKRIGMNRICCTVNAISYCIVYRTACNCSWHDSFRGTYCTLPRINMIHAIPSFGLGVYYSTGVQHHPTKLFRDIIHDRLHQQILAHCLLVWSVSLHSDDWPSGLFGKCVQQQFMGMMI